MFAALIVLMAVAVAACGDSETSVTTLASTTETTNASTADTASIGGSNRVIVGGQSQEDYASSIPELQKAVDANPTDLVALQNLAVAQYNSDRLDDAAATYQKMLVIKDDPTVHNNYANVLRDLKKTDQAIAEYRKAIEGNPALASAYINLASLYVSQKNVTEAQKVLEAGIAKTTGTDQQSLKDYKANISQGS